MTTGTAASPGATPAWAIIRSPDRPRAVALAGPGATIAALAELVGLGAEEEEWRGWLSVPTMQVALTDGRVVAVGELTANDVLAPGQEVGVPNRVLMLWTGDLGWLGRLAVGWGRERAYLERLGFNVQEVRVEERGPTRQEDVLELFRVGTEEGALHGLFVTGHGNKGLFGWRDKLGLAYFEIEDRLRYGLGLVVLNVCDGGWCRADGEEMAGGRDLISTSAGARFHGVKHWLFPRVFFVSGHARRARDVLRPGEQGTRA